MPDEPTTSELSIKIDGTELNRFGWNIAHGGWRMPTAPKRGDNPVMAYIDGRKWQQKNYDQRQLTLPMWVVGCQYDGSPPELNTQRTEMLSNLRVLRNLFTTDKALRTIEVYDPVLAKTVEAQFETVDVIDFQSMAGLTRALFVPTIVLPYVWFRDQAYQYDVANHTVRNNAASWEVTPDTDSEIWDPVIHLEGAATNPKLTNAGVANHWVKYVGTLAAAEVVTINCRTYSASSSVSGDVSNLLDWSSIRREMFVLIHGAQTITYNGDTSCKVQINWKGCYW